MWCVLSLGWVNLLIFHTTLTLTKSGAKISSSLRFEKKDKKK